MSARPTIRVVVETAHRYHRESSIDVQKRQARTAYLAEDMGESLCFGKLVGLEVVLALREAQCIDRGEEIGCESRPSNLATSLAVAVVSPDRILADFVANGAAETATCDHEMLLASDVRLDTSRCSAPDRCAESPWRTRLREVNLGIWLQRSC